MGLGFGLYLLEVEEIIQDPTLGHDNLFLFFIYVYKILKVFLFFFFLMYYYWRVSIAY